MTKKQNMPSLTIKISEAEIEKLNYERYAYPDPLIQKRINAVYLKCTLGWSNSTIGLAVGLHYNVVGQWLKVYREKGYDGLLTNRYGGKKSEMEKYHSSIIESFQTQAPLTTAEAANRIKELTGLVRSNQQVGVFLKRHGFKFIKCGHIPAKANNEDQHEWVDNVLKPVVEAAQIGQVHLFFSDAAHFVLAPFICRLWCMVRIFLKASAGRNRINVLGAVNAITKEVTTITNKTYITSSTLIEFLLLLKEKYADKPIAIVLDNARYQHCFTVKTMAKSLGIHLLFLPPYSPNLNIIERLWKFTKKKILYAKYYENPAAFHLAIETFFKEINQKFIHELKSLLSLEFQFFDSKDSLIYPL